MLTYLYVKVGRQDTGGIQSSANPCTALLLLLWRQHSRTTRNTSASCITRDGCCLIKLRHSASAWIHRHYMFEMLIHAVQVEMVVLHVVCGLLLLLVKMVLGMVRMMCNGMVVNVRVVVRMMVVVLHTFR